MKKILTVIVFLLFATFITGCSNDSTAGYIDDHTGEGEYDNEIIQWLLQGDPIFYDSEEGNCIWASYSQFSSVYKSYEFLENGKYVYEEANYSFDMDNTNTINKEEGTWKVSNNIL